MNEISKVAQPEGRNSQDLVHQVSESDGDMIARWQNDAEAIATSIDVRTDDGRILAGKCGGTADLKTRNIVGQVIVATGFYAHVAEVANGETGEVMRKIRVVLILDDGRTVSTMSGPCARSLSKMIKLRADGHAKWPIHIETREYTLESGKSYCDMREVLMDSPKKVKRT